MTTYPDDVIRLAVDGRSSIYRLSELEMAWPPPAAVLIVGDDGKLCLLHRLAMSEITDEERAGLKHLIRGALYVTRAEMERAGFRELVPKGRTDAGGRR